MLKEIALITYELKPGQKEAIYSGIERFNSYCKNIGINVFINEDLGELPPHKTDPGLEGISCLEDCIEKNNFNFGKLDRFLDFRFMDPERYKNFKKGYSNFLIGVGKKLVSCKNDVWHMDFRGGEAYGLQKNNRRKKIMCTVITLEPLTQISTQKNKETYIDYVIRHEVGHNIIPSPDLSFDAPDNIMKPVCIATDNYLDSKNVEYSKEQIELIHKEINFS